jgi:serine/threonine protein kinase
MNDREVESEVFGPFLLIRALGRGGMGEVFIARTPWEEHRLAAVKRLRPDIARLSTFVERFRHEAALAVRLNHPNVVGTLDVGTVDEQIYVASELVLGKDIGVIANRLREERLGGPIAVAIRIASDALSGLAYVHGAREADGTPLGLVHRDVTPGNLLVGYDGVARLADFGLAKSLLSRNHRLTNHGEVLGTPHYLSPEVVRGQEASQASDIYGLGAVIYRFLTGLAPFHGSSAEVMIKVLSERPKPLSELRPDLPEWLVDFVNKMMTRDSDLRPRDAVQLNERLLKEARASALLVPRASVGRWLGQLFEAERVSEFRERDFVASIEHAAPGQTVEGTVVLARKVKGRNLGSSVSGELPSPSSEQPAFAPDHEAEVTRNDRALQGFGSSERPDELEETHQAVALDRDSVEELEELPTRAVEFFPPKAKARSRPPSEEHELPGFVDVPEQELHTGTAFEVAKLRDSDWRSRNHEKERIEESLPDAPAIALPPIDMSTRLERPVRRDQVSEEGPSMHGNIPSPRTWYRPHTIVMVALVMLSLMLGVTIAALMFSSQDAGRALEANADVNERFLKAKHNLEELAEKDEAAVPTDAWRNLSRAAAALVEQDLPGARLALDRVDDFVREQKVRQRVEKHVNKQ